MKRALPEFITSTGSNFKKRNYDIDEKKRLIQYMNTAGELCAAAGYVDDLVTGKETRIENGGYHDGFYEWSTQEIYHIDKYNAAVSDEFLKRALEKVG